MSAMLPHTSSYAEAHQRTRNDLARLQGAWTAVSGRRPAELLVAGNLYTVRFLDGAIYMGTFEIDPGESPPAMDMRIDEGPIKHKGQITLCIYDLSADTLRWCPGKPGTDHRPESFPCEDDPDGLCLVFRRELPRPHQA
jgi:uncharacterized protein (TIGR03067 family)